MFLKKIKPYRLGLTNLANKRPYRFFLHRGSMTLSVLISIISLLVIIALSLKINGIEEPVISVSSNADNPILQQNKESNKVVLSTLKDVCVVVCSIFGSNFLLSLIIQKKSQNDLYDEFITEDLLQNRKFIKSIPKDNRKILLKSIEEIDFFSENKIYSKLIDSVRDKIAESHYPYYYISHNMDIICSIESNYIEKEIIKTVEIGSFEKCKTIKSFVISKFVLEELSGVKNVEIKKLTINDENKDIDNCIEYVYNENNDNVYLANVNYNKKGLCRLKDRITFYNDKPTKIEITYTTRVPLSDKVFTSRLSSPCKNYHFHFRIDDSVNNYKIYAQAFGFQDDAMKNPAGSRKNEITYEINDWAFPTDGVFVTFYK